MAYNRVNWEDSPSTNTPVNATNLNTMDAGIEQNANDIEDLQDDVDEVKSNLNHKTYDYSNKVNITLPYTATKEGLIILKANANSGGYFSIIIDGLTVNGCSTNAIYTTTINAVVGKNNIVTKDTLNGAIIGSSYFVPLNS